ncbi:hypothetical protein KUK79_003662 [Vibrio parahaemolyticus]|uniref:hypothetical protein n=1 Tax=Vibrio parahaemolyticus TaxID=670 RepID=UPI00084AC0BD|nr:hypothetical protein [Vibrio parahaemolyticus]EHR6178987.1 hypothetical protein [Vibrio parahaemolyticus]ODY35137.1 hypothetical protein BBM21_03030 [Vibrio parahaemolyticus]
MSEYFFARECVNSPIYCFPEEYIDSVPSTSFTYPKAPVPLIVEFLPQDDYDIPDILEMPNFSIKKNEFSKLNLNNIFGINWVDIKLHDKGEHDFLMLQVVNEIKLIDRSESKIKRYRKDSSGDEMISGILNLILDEKLIQTIPVDRRQIVIDPGWLKCVFFHKSLVEKIKNAKLVGVEFIPADGYSDFR